MTAPSRLRLACRLCPALLLALCCPAARAQQPEGRDFQVFVDGKPAGDYHLTITPAAGGKTVVAARAAVRVRFGLYTYTYSFQGTEVWAGGLPERVDCTAVDGGKRASVSAAVQGDRAAVTVNGKGRADRAFAWTTTHWRLPEGAAADQGVTLLDVDTGKVVAGRLQLVGEERLSLAGQARACRHYRVSGGDQAEMWFDESGRLVRQQTVEEGHRTELRLAGLRPGG